MGHLRGSLRDDANYPVVGAHVSVRSGDYIQQSFSDVNGDFSFVLPAHKRYVLSVTHLMYQPVQKKFLLSVGEPLLLRVTMHESVLMLNQVSVAPQPESQKPTAEAGLINIDTKSLRQLPAVTQDVTQIIALLPGVVSSSALSTTYSVRGGAHEENLVYIEGIPVYRAYINNAGEQEGLGLVNPALVQDMRFSSGAWGPDRGDKLSSVLDVSYLSPTQNRGSVQMSLLGGSAHYEIGSSTGTFAHLAAVRYKDTRALLTNNALQGQYQPTFLDAQYLLRWYPRKRAAEKFPSQRVTFLASYARNRYQLFPQAQRVKFGTLGRPLLFHVDLSGKFLLRHDVYQLGINSSQIIAPKVRLETIHTYASSAEQQFTDVETGYRLCDVLPPVPGQRQAELCAQEVAVGREIIYARNFLLGHATFHEANISMPFTPRSTMKIGINASYDDVRDIISEHQYADQEARLTILHAISQRNILRRMLYGGYWQYTLHSFGSSRARVQGGVRWGYNRLSREFWVSPRLRVSFQATDNAPIRYTLGTGLYYQPPSYREARDISGVLNTRVRAQRAVHLLAGGVRNFRMWDRRFGCSAEAYYKHLDRLIPYDQRDVLLQYYAQNISSGYAYGMDFRLFGFFLPEEESWFSLGLLSTAEDIQQDNTTYIRRPTDQRANVGIFFRDHLPKIRAWKVSLRALYGSGLPFNPPGKPIYRNQFRGSAYYRVDVGFYRSLLSERSRLRTRGRLRNLTLTLEALNLLGSRRVISYSWIQTTTQQQFAVPNAYAVRFFNAKVEASF